MSPRAAASTVCTTTCRIAFSSASWLTASLLTAPCLLHPAPSATAALSTMEASVLARTGISEPRLRADEVTSAEHVVVARRRAAQGIVHARIGSDDRRLFVEHVVDACAQRQRGVHIPRGLHAEQVIAR